jgi:hypothetical protein
LTEGNWQKIGKSLSDTAFNLDWRSGHESLPWPESPRKLQISYFSPPAAVREAIKAFLQEKFSNCRFVVLVFKPGIAPALNSVHQPVEKCRRGPAKLPAI